jgi:hypothetical protein
MADQPGAEIARELLKMQRRSIERATVGLDHP